MMRPANIAEMVFYKDGKLELTSLAAKPVFSAYVDIPTLG
jgi:hypothetical protein